MFQDPSSCQVRNGRTEGQQETSGEVARETAGGLAEDGLRCPKGPSAVVETFDTCPVTVATALCGSQSLEMWLV